MWAEKKSHVQAKNGFESNDDRNWLNMYVIVVICYFDQRKKKTRIHNIWIRQTVLILRAIYATTKSIDSETEFAYGFSVERRDSELGKTEKKNENWPNKND